MKVDGALESSSDREGEISLSFTTKMMKTMMMLEESQSDSPLPASSQIFTSCEATKRFSPDFLLPQLQMLIVMMMRRGGSGKMIVGGIPISTCLSIHP